jgi:dolichol-phosphate mannosyltransferase
MQPNSTLEKFALVVPALKEAGNLPTLIDRAQIALSRQNNDYELIIVDDDSQDGTEELVQEYSRRDPRVRLLVRKDARGLSGAVLHGWNHTDATLLGVMDADLQHPPELLPALIAGIAEGNDIAVASRYVAKDSVSNWNAARQVISRFGTLAATLPLKRRGLKIKDPLSGFFIVRRDCIDGLELEPYGFKILLEILVKGRIRKAVEVPFKFASRHAGQSKADLKIAFQYFSLLGKLSRHAFFGPGSQ